MSSGNTQQSVWTPANIVTLVRIVLVPVFVVILLTPWPSWFAQFPILQVLQPCIAALFFVVLALTDSLDGYLARSRNEVTDFGKFMDPLADKLLVCSALVALVDLGTLPSWVVIIIIGRDFIMSGVRLVAAAQGQVIAASWYGKFKTAFQMVAIVMFLVWDITPLLFGVEVGSVFHVLTWIVMGVALVLTVVSLVDYFYHARYLFGFGEKPKSELEIGEGEEEAEGECCGEADERSVSYDELSLRARSLSQNIIEQATAANVTISTCESLTGGMIGAYLTSVPGSSAVVRGGLITYATDTKHDLAGVAEECLEETGPVDRVVAEQMAQGSHAACGSDIAVAVTGIAGPGGEEPGKPVGYVWIALCAAGTTYAECEQFTGSRDDVRLQTVCRALEMILAQLSSDSDLR